MKYLLMTLCLFSVTAIGAAEGGEGADAHEADRAALRTLMETMTKALNDSDFEVFSAHLADGFNITFADQKTFASVKELAAYKEDLTKISGITAMTFAPKIDGPATFINKDIAMSTGTSVDSFTSSAGTIAIPSRWTATVARDSGGAWKIASFHSGVNLLDNPILDRTKSAMNTMLLIIGIIAAIVGLIIGVFIGRRAKG